MRADRILKIWPCHFKEYFEKYTTYASTTFKTAVYTQM